MSSQISRRDFLKSVLLLPLMPLIPPLNKQSHFVGTMNTMPHNQVTPNVLILVFDALSARHMSLYGYNRETTPHLARFAQRATVYHTHYAGGNYTTPGVSSLLTGTYPWSHRAFNSKATVAESYKHRNLFRTFTGEIYNKIAYAQNRLANVLLNQCHEDINIYLNPQQFSLFDSHLSEWMFPDDRDVAYRSEEFLLSEEIPGSLFLSVADKIRSHIEENIKRGWSDLYPRGLPKNDSKSIFLLEHVIDGIKTLTSDSRQPFVGYLHLMPPHEPYRPRRAFIGLFDDGWTPEAKRPHFFSMGFSDEVLNQWRREYDEYLAYTDAEFGRLYDFMKQTGMLDNTYFVLTSDHGQMFERGIHGHSGPTLYEPVIRVPLLISKPKQQQREDVYTPTSCVDLLPTLLYATGQAIPDWCEGEVLPTFDDEETRSGRSIFSVEAKRNPKHAPLTKGTVTLIKGQYKLIHYFGYDGYENEYELYDLLNDPEEVETLYSSKKSIAKDLQSELREKLYEVNQPYLST